MKLLVLASEPVSADRIRHAIGGDRLADAEVMVVAPAFQDSPIKFWTSDADDAIARAEDVSSETIEELDEAGLSAIGDTGESDPLEAIQDALQTFRADQILVFTHAESEQRYREDVDPEEIKARFGLPVTVTNVPSTTG
jgi:hypothetical protein